MKRTARILFSAMLVLMFVFSFAGAAPAARAEDDGAITPSFLLWHDAEGELNEGYQPYEDVDSITVSYGKDNDEDPLPATIANLKANGVTITVPADLYVDSIILSANDKELLLNPFAELREEEGEGEGEKQTYLEVPAKVFEDDGDKNILDELKDAGNYVLEIKFHQKGDKPVTVSYSAGELTETLGDLFDDDEVSAPFEAAGLSQDQLDQAAKNAYKGFTGWKLIYDPSGISMDVPAGSTISPYQNCTLVAQWEDIIVIIASQSEVPAYDGNAHKAAVTVNGAAVSEDNKASAALDGKNITVEVTNLDSDGSITDYLPEGKVYTPAVTASDENNEPVDSSRIRVFPCTLNVTRRNITVTVKSAEKIYDGTALTASEADVTDGSVLESHKISYQFTGSQTVPNDTAETLTECSAEATILDASEKDVTGNYNITVVPGTLKVTVRPVENRIPLTIAPKADTKEYDGTPLTPPGYDCTGTLLPGDELTVEYDGSCTDAKTVESSIKSVTVTHDGTNVTENYSIDSSAKSTLTVTPRPITITADSDSKPFDGTPLTKNTAHVTSGSILEELGHKVSAIKIVGSRTEEGTSENIIETGSVRITDGTRDVTSNYAITLAKGTLEVTAKAITDITITVNESKVYDGTPLTLTADKIKVTPALPSGYTISATFSVSERTVAGKDEVTLTNIVIKDASNNDVTAKFNRQVEKGSLEVTKRPLTITTGDKTKVYDGKALTDRTVPTVEGQVNGHNIELKFTGTQTKVGSSDNSVEVLSIKDSETKAEVTGNYEITYKYGKLTVTSATGTSSNSTVGTGDSNNIWIWVLLMVAAAGAAVAVVIFVRKSKKNGNEQ